MMNIEEIRKNAPECSTHYEPYGDDVIYYARDTIGRWCYVEDSSGSGYPVSCSEMERLDIEAKPL